MRFNRPLEHLNDDQLLAYLDGEMSNARMRAIRNHLRICWKCRSALTELEAQVEAISRLLLASSKFDADRSARAKERFLQWRDSFELVCPIFCTSLVVSVAQLSLSIDSRSRGCGEVGSA
jgi:anti-sigma factor RsiW